MSEREATSTRLLGETLGAHIEMNKCWGCGYRTRNSGNRFPLQLFAAVGNINAARAYYESGLAAGNVSAIQNIILTTFVFSQHTGGSHFAYADGSVHFLSENMNLSTDQSLGAMADGLPIGGFVP